MAFRDIPLTLYLSPCRQFDRLRALREQYGDRAVLTGLRFRREREAWVVAAFLMGYGELTGQFWWLTICPAIAPGIIAISPRRGERGWVAERLDLAVLEYEAHASLARVAAAIAGTLRDRALAVDDRLVCHVQHRAGEVLDTGAVAAQLARMDLPPEEVWLVGSVESDQSDDYVVSRLRPEPWERRLSYLQHCSETPQLAILDAGQGSGEAIPHGFMEIALP
jgi:hypothetical protein